MKKIWISGLVPQDGADVYNGIRLAVSDTEREALADLVEWVKDAADDNSPDQEKDSLEDLRQYVDGSLLVQYWNVEERDV